MELLYLIGALIAVLCIIAIFERFKSIPIALAEKKAVEQLAAKTREQQADLTRERKQFEELKAESEIAMETLSREKSQGFPWLAEAYSQYQKLFDLKLADNLEDKQHPAKRAAEHVREMAAEKAALKRENKILRELHRYYEDLFPWLIDFKGEDLDDLIRQVHDRPGRGTGRNSEDEDDPAILWLTEAERISQKLSRPEKFQRALDRYWQSKKTPWQIGRDYERFIGYIHEKQGFRVEYHGVEQGLEDLGRDLVCTRDGEVRIVQCKHWSASKTLHEKHVCQVFGTAMAYEKERGCQPSLFPNPKVTPYLYISCTASERAHQFAEMLGVVLIDNYLLRRYPIIKCNVSLRDGQKIYHLPFDQQYDRTLIENRDERYVETVAEAEALGFRRAFRWRGFRDPS